MLWIYESMVNEFMIEQQQYGSKRLKTMIAWAHEKIIPILEAYNIHQDDFILLLTGSDWRRENRKEASWVEMIAYTNRDLAKNMIIKITSEIWDLFMWYNRLSVTKKVYWTNKVEVEPKRFTNISNFEDPYTDYNVFFPSRFLDGALLFGSDLAYESLFALFQKDVVSAQASDMTTFKSRIKYAQDITLQWKRDFKWKSITHFDFEKNEIYYEKTAHLERWVKMWPLRYVQYKFCFLIVQLLRTQQINYKDLIWMNPFISDKIELIRNFIKWGIDESKITDLRTTYYTFLKIHHICQKEYRNSENGFTYMFDTCESKLLREMTKTLSEIIQTLRVS